MYAKKVIRHKDETTKINHNIPKGQSFSISFFIIFISLDTVIRVMLKTTKILKILYPDKVDVTDAIRISNTIVPLIDTLIQTAAWPFKSVEPIQTIPAVLKPLKMADKLDVPATEYPEFKQLYPIFEECEKHHIDSTYHETKFGQSKYLKNDEKVIFQADSCRIDTTWDTLNVFYNLLPDETVINELVSPEFSIKKARTLTNFYCDHPNWRCHIEMKNKFNVLVKDTVTLQQDTQRNGDTGTVDADTYGSEE